jgi:hypothetical protein
MFNLFKSSPQNVIVKIHNDFDSATERLLKEAKGIIAKEFSTDKGDRLAKLGFTSSAASKKANEVKAAKTKSRELADQITYFQIQYPNHKFITEEAVMAICKKYGLVFGGVNFYIGDVPEKNVREMEKFVLKEEDCTKHPCMYWKTDGRGYPSPAFRKEDSRFYGYVSRSQWGYDYKIVVDESTPCVYEKPQFQICASKDDFDLTNMRVEKGYKLVSIPDPIVLQPVKGGYLIVTKWGLEASDPSLVNEIHN